MSVITYILDMLRHPDAFLAGLGSYAMWVTFIIVFAESGLFVGFFLPGDSLLFTAGMFAARGYMPIVALCIGCFVAAVLGDTVGYWFGKRFGRGIFEKEQLPLVKKRHIEQAEQFYAKHGKNTIILARFIPIIRTFAPIVAGMAHMSYGTFISYNLIGGLLWAVGVTLLGYFLGSIEIIRDHYELAILVIICVSIIPVVVHIIQEKRHRRKPGADFDQLILP